jgi:hypothetical protein
MAPSHAGMHTPNPSRDKCPAHEGLFVIQKCKNKCTGKEFFRPNPSLAIFTVPGE